MAGAIEWRLSPEGGGEMKTWQQIIKSKEYKSSVRGAIRELMKQLMKKYKYIPLSKLP